MGLRVLIVSNFFPPNVMGGAEIVAHRQAGALREAGHDVAIFAGGLKSSAKGRLEAERADGLPVYRIAHRSLEPEGNFHDPAVVAFFRSVLSLHRPEIVHFHNVTGLGASLIPEAKSFGARVVTTLHDYWGICFKNTLLRNDGSLCDDVERCAVCLPTIPAGAGERLPIRLRRDFVARCLDRSDHLISPSGYLARTYESSGVLRTPVEHVSNGMECSRIPISPPREAEAPIRFATFSYLGEHKGIPVLLEAAAMLAADRSLDQRWHLTIAGGGHLAGVVGDAAASDRLREHVTYVGKLPREDALSLAQEVDAIVLASRWPENEPVSLLEAIATGTAQIATRLGGNVDLVDDERSGLLVEPDDAASLAAAMRRMIEDPKLVVRFGSYNAARRDRFDEGRTVARLDELYRTLQSGPTIPDVPVLCAGRAPSPLFSQDLALMVDRLERLEGEGPRLRLVWHEWADADLWMEARLLWLWGEVGVEALPLVSRAFRAGTPVLGPSDSVLAPMFDESDAGTYDDLLGAMAKLAALQRSPREGRLGSHARDAARRLNRMAPRETFHLAVDRPS